MIDDPHAIDEQKHSKKYIDNIRQKQKQQILKQKIEKNPEVSITSTPWGQTITTIIIKELQFLRDGYVKITTPTQSIVIAHMNTIQTKD